MQRAGQAASFCTCRRLILQPQAARLLLVSQRSVRLGHRSGPGRKPLERYRECRGIVQAGSAVVCDSGQRVQESSESESESDEEDVEVEVAPPPQPVIAAARPRAAEPSKKKKRKPDATPAVQPPPVRPSAETFSPRRQIK